MIRIGAHMSIAGGYYRAVETAAEMGCDVVQLFLKNNNQWRAKPITDDDVDRFRTALETHRIEQPLAHASYLINLASPDRALWEKSIAALVVELERAARLGVPHVVVHPGAYTTSTPKQGMRRIARALDRVHRTLGPHPASVLLENTAGQGTVLGWDFHQLAQIIDQCRAPERVGVCIDTCHAFAAGYAWSPAGRFRETVGQLGELIGWERIKALHINDSKRELGSRVDRHAHIGAGQIGVEGFHRIVRHRHLRRIPMYLETPKGDDPDTGRPWDRINLERIRELAQRPLTQGTPARNGGTSGGTKGRVGRTRRKD